MDDMWGDVGDPKLVKPVICAQELLAGKAHDTFPVFIFTVLRQLRHPNPRV